MQKCQQNSLHIQAKGKTGLSFEICHALFSREANTISRDQLSQVDIMAGYLNTIRNCVVWVNH